MARKQIESTELLTEFGCDVESRTVVIDGEIEEGSFYNFNVAMTTLENKSSEPITIKLNSGGGDVLEGNAIIGRIVASPCEINIEAYGIIASMAVYILASGDHRSAHELTTFMHHECSYGSDDKHSQNKAYVKHTEAEQTTRNKWLTKRTKKDLKFWQTTGVGVDYYFTPDQALEFGLIHEIFE